MGCNVTIVRLEGAVARAATNALRFLAPLEDIATELFRWQHRLNSILVPASFPVPKTTASPTADAGAASHYREQAATIRDKILKVQAGTRRGAKRKRPSYLIAGDQVWFLASASSFTQGASEALVRANPVVYIQLVLLKELLEQSGIAMKNPDSVGGVGPGAYLMHQVGNHGRTLQLAELRFDILPRYGVLICNVRSCSYYKADSEARLHYGALDAGHGYSIDIVDFGDASATRLDARKQPIRGINLRKSEFRRTRLYYLNVLTEFTLSVLERAGIPAEREQFEATHYVSDCYLPLASIASLVRPLVIANATSETMDEAELRPLGNLKTCFPHGFHVSGGSVDYVQPEIRLAAKVPELIRSDLNYLFLNGSQAAGTSVFIQRSGTTGTEVVSSAHAYACLDAQVATTDAYTRIKYDYLLNQKTFSLCFQGLDEFPTVLRAALETNNAGCRSLREKLKRCLVDLSLKPFPASALVPIATGKRLTLVGTRTFKAGRTTTRTLIASVHVEIGNDGIWVRSTRRTRWSHERGDNLLFVEQFPFLLNPDRKVRDKQFCIVDTTTGSRLQAWNGSFIPKIILNARYPSIEAALARQDASRSIDSHAFYSKSKSHNILPYYISMRDGGTRERADQVGRLIALQDRGDWVRIFIPPADGIDGTGTSLSGMRDVMIYTASGELIPHPLDEPLLQIYLHSMTNGILVAGGNSKMSILEKIVRLTLEN
jgi:hypothetical protein